MVEIGRLVGQKVIIALKKSVLESDLFAGTFQGENIFVADIAGVDFIGLWVAIPDVVLIKVKDEDGKPLPEKKRTETQAKEHFLIKWDYIDTISAFVGIEEEIIYYQKPIGFLRKSKKGAEPKA